LQICLTRGTEQFKNSRETKGRNLKKDARLFLVSNEIDTYSFFMYVYFYSLHVSGSHVPIIRRINCINMTSDIVAYIRCHIDTINSPDDGHMADRNMQRIEINTHWKRFVHQVGHLQKLYRNLRSTKHKKIGYKLCNQQVWYCFRIYKIYIYIFLHKLRKILLEIHEIPVWS